MTINGYFSKKPEIVSAAHIAISALWHQGKINPHIHAKIPLSEFAEAFRMLENREVIGKVILSMK